MAACLRMSLKFLGVDELEADLRQLLETQFPLGTPFANVARAVQQWDLRMELGFSNITELITALAANKAAILFLQTGYLDYWHGDNERHAVTITGIDSVAGNVSINDPSFPSPQMSSLSSFEQAWSEDGNLTAFLAKR